MKKIYRLLLALVLGLSFTEYSFAAEALEGKERESKEGAAAEFASLHEAAEAGDVEAVNKMLTVAGVDVDERDERDDYPGSTPLILAAEEGHVGVVEALIKARAEVDKVNNNGHTALMGAAREGNVDVIKVLIESGALIDREDTEGYHETALNFAVENNRGEAVKTLIFAGADLSAELILAVMRRRVDLVKTLIFAGADPHRENNAHQTAWKIADTAMKKVILEALKERDESRRLNRALSKNEDTPSGPGRSLLGGVMEGMPGPLRGLVAEYAEVPFGQHSMARAAREREVVARRQREEAAAQEQEAAGSAAAQEEPKVMDWESLD
ncbi:MAG: ankyrin repeat domain-containing protein [Candidatus Dependentiae bacterium]|nr:ankyrin repeat domain-containing protein [Candidatus Dependentiae bacterium]